MYRTLIGILAAFALALLVAGFTFQTTTDGPADFRMVNGSEPKTLDPHLATGETESRLLWELFEGLVRYNPKTMKPAPGVAESWEISEDGKRYVFHLRENARWSDGSRVTAHDFAYSFRRLLTPELGAEYAYIISPIRHSIELNTFDTLADGLEKKLRPGVERLRVEHRQGVAAAVWQRFLAEQHAHEALEHATGTLIPRLVRQNDGTVSPLDLESLARALRELETQLRRAAAEAKAHFGVDQGAFARDDRTFVIELRAPTPYFLEILCFYPAMPVHRKTVETSKNRDAWFLPDTMVSNGPYRLKTWLVNDRIRLERSETYWDKAQVRLKNVDLLATESATTALNLYLTGAIDWLPKLYPKDLVDVIKHRPDFYAAPGLVVYYYRLNTTRKPLDDKRVRKAINLAIDRETIVRDVLRLGQLPAYTYVPPGLPGYEPTDAKLSFDVPRAKALLAEAGFPNGAGFPKFGILYNTNDDHKKLAEVVADMLRRNLGIEVTPYNQEWQSYLEAQRYLNYEMSRAGWVGDYNDPNTFLDMWVTNGGNNQTGFASARYDRLIRLAADVSPLVDDPDPILAGLKEPARIRPWLEAARGTGPERLRAREKIRMAIFREAETLLIGEELPIVPIYFYVNAGLLRQNVRGFYTELESDSKVRAINLKDVHPINAMYIEGKP